MKFDYIVGNPPYQEEQASQYFDESMKNFAPPIYNFFMDECYKIANTCILIHPARFLFDAGSTPKDWNKKMLDDEHFKVLCYEEDSHRYFPTLTTPIKGGIAITCRNQKRRYNAITAFTKYPIVNNILQKVINSSNYKTLLNIVYSRTIYRLTDKMHSDNPFAILRLSNGHMYDMSSNIMTLLPEIFYDTKPGNGLSYIKIIGRINNKRVVKYINREYIKQVENIDYYKLFIAQANGSGEFGETLSDSEIGEPETASTETFISIGKFETINEVRSLDKYIRTRFARTLLSILKVTQNGNKPVWRLVLLQDFTKSSDINWSKSIPEIDQQLYKKYGLDKDEIEFIESHVKAMD